MDVRLQTWDDLIFWRSPEWQVIQERLDDLDHNGSVRYCPERERIFTALDSTPFSTTKVVICGQDPYLQRHLASGLAFSVPNGSVPTGHCPPPTLTAILEEYVNDLHHPYPKGTSLHAWASRGVLLWNVIPTCLEGRSLSHDWCEWVPLTTEILSRLSDRGKVVFIFMGAVARRYTHVVDTTVDLSSGIPRNVVIQTSHPSPRGQGRSAVPFKNCRFCSRSNGALTSMGVAPIDWRLI
jgi:uracil-DNA glycosylase